MAIKMLNSLILTPSKITLCMYVYMYINLYLSFLKVPDYFDIIKCPMDLSSVMKKIDEHRYNVPKEWLYDIDLITCNALE